MEGASGYLTPIEDEPEEMEEGEMEEKDENNPLTAPVFEFEHEATSTCNTVVV